MVQFNLVMRVRARTGPRPAKNKYNTERQRKINNTGRMYCALLPALPISVLPLS